MDHVFYRPDLLSLDDLAAPRDTFLGTNHTDLTAAVSKLYNKYMVIAAHLNLKRGNSALPPEDREIKGLKSTFVTRTKVDKKSKTILQVQLAVTVILGLVTHLSIDLRGTPPGPPTSIGAVMSLLADSEICDPESGLFGQAPANISENGLRKLLDGWLFSLCWWGARGSSPNSVAGGIGVGPSLDKHEITDTVTSVASKKDKRFGIDAGKADTSGFSSSWPGRDRAGKSQRRKRTSTKSNPEIVFRDLDHSSPSPTTTSSTIDTIAHQETHTFRVNQVHFA